jgi:hypothetical protein
VPRSPQPQYAVESPSHRRTLTAAIRTAVVIRVYGNLPDGGLTVIDVPAGLLTPPYVEQARTAGATGITIRALAGDGSTLDLVRVRA